MKDNRAFEVLTTALEQHRSARKFAEHDRVQWLHKLKDAQDAITRYDNNIDSHTKAENELIDAIALLETTAEKERL